MGDRVILRLEDIVKTFPGVKALDGVKLDVKGGGGSCALRGERSRQINPDEDHCRRAGLYLRSYVHQ